MVVGAANSYLTNATRHYEAKGSEFEPTISKEATCTEDGCINYQCTICGYSYNDCIEALGHNFVDGVCSRCGMLEEDCIESKHDYSNNCDETWIISKDGAKWMAITFSDEIPNFLATQIAANAL